MSKRRSSAKVAADLLKSKVLRVGVLAALLMSTSSIALHAQDRDLQKELDQLKAQINSLKAAIGEQRVETRRNREKIRTVAERGPVVPVLAPGYTGGGFQPIGGYDDKKLHFGGITITPGGFFAAEGIFRSRAIGSDIATAWANTPLQQNSLGHTNELRLSARQSRFALLVEGAISPSILGAGYIETDFQGAGTTSNNNQSNGYVPRMRQIYGTLDFLDSGYHVLAGQAFSLLTLNSKGITPRNEVGTPAIDGQPIPGYVYARQPQIRLTKDFDKKLWLSLSAEASQTTFATGCAGLVGNIFGAATANAAQAGATVTCAETGSGGATGQTGQNQQYSLNHAPDIIAKAAYEARFLDRDIHIEGMGMYRNFYDRVNYSPVGAVATSNNSLNLSKNGFSAGAGIIVPVMPKLLDFQGSMLAGQGIARYGSAGFSDAALNANGSIRALTGVDFSAGLTLHATSALDIYGFAGMEQLNSAYSQGQGVAANFGYGNPQAIDIGCNLEGSAAATCQSQTHRVYVATVGLWDKVYEGKFGYFRAGVEYIYTKRELFPGQATATVTGNMTKPTADNQLIETSLRYYPF